MLLTSALKGKSTRTKMCHVINDDVKIRKKLVAKNEKVKLEIEIMNINEEIFLTTIQRSIKFRACVLLVRWKANNIYEALDIVIRNYNES